MDPMLRQIGNSFVVGLNYIFFFFAMQVDILELDIFNRLLLLKEYFIFSWI